MRGSRSAIATACVLVLGLTARANEKPTEAYQQAMKDLAGANAALRSDVRAIEAAGAYPDYNPIEKDVVSLKGGFTTAASFWTARNVDDATKLATAGLAHVDELDSARKDKNYDALMTAATEIGKTCGSCHAAHRDKLADGTFEIK
jgi:cytochrome c556